MLRAIAPTLLVSTFLVAASCAPNDLPIRPAACDAEGVGCLPDETCVSGQCLLREKCDDDEDCPSEAWTCVFPSQICQLRPGFGEECSDEAPCDPGQFCALGKCRVRVESRECGSHEDCPVGEKCDRSVFFCIEEASCNLVDAFPEVGCDPDETCDSFSGRCRLQCQDQCDVETQEDDCGANRFCDPACRCVDCLSDDDCGAGLVCNERLGRCESEDLCFDDTDCEAPLVCDPRTALCQVPPPPCDSDADCAIAEICNRLTGACELPGGPCIDDYLEQADTPASAEELVPAQPGAEPELFDDLQLCPDDDDVYAVTLVRGEELTARITRTTPLARATVWLLNEDGETSLAFSETPPRGAGTVVYTAQADETVYLRINALVGPTPYDLALSLGGGVACSADPFEGFDGNDTPALATPAANVPIGFTLAASVCSDDVDYYAVSLAAGEGLEARAQFDAAAADFDVAIVDTDGDTVLAQSATLQAPEVARVRAPNAQEVLVRVRAFGASIGTYDLTLNRLAPIECTQDAFEPDDDAATAPVLAIEQDLAAVARTICTGESDQYQVVLRDFERLVAHATYQPGDVDLVLQVLDATGTEVRATSPFSTGGATVTYDARGDETVLVRIAGRASSQGPYTLDVFRENQVTCTPDALEPNSVVTQASPLPDPAALLTICGSDEDYFAIDGVAGKTLHVHTSFVQADGDLDLMIIGIDDEDVLAVSDSIDDGEDIRVVLPLDGKYSIRVFSLQGGATRSRYSLAAELLDE